VPLAGFPGLESEALVGALPGLQQGEDVFHDAAVFGEIGMSEQPARCVAGIDGFHALHDNPRKGAGYIIKWFNDNKDLVACDKSSLNIFWIEDESLEGSDNLPTSEVIAQEIVEDQEAALEQFREIAGDLGGVDIEEESA